MEVEYQVTAKVVGKNKTLPLSRVTFKCFYVLNLVHSQLFMNAMVPYSVLSE